MKTKHTPGPWNIDKTTSESGYLISSDIEPTPLMQTIGRSGVDLANAKLAKAAPGLLEALQMAYNTLKATYPMFNEWPECAVIEAAIKEATE